MTNSFSLQQILLNQLPVPQKLLTGYISLGLNEIEVMVILQLHRFLQEENDFPTPYEIAEHLTINEKDCANILRKLIQKNFLLINQKENEKNQISEAYSLNPLWKKLYTTEQQPKEEQEEQLDGTIFILFEQEFGRPLSPFEIETINAWLDEDKIAPSLIKAGLRESVLMGKLNFKYIDRILREWKKKGIHSVEQAREASKNFHHKQEKKQENTTKRDTSFYYNWLEGED
ncbi:DnaD domain-containing protein [Virgibacillus ainsalahensis]